ALSPVALSTAALPNWFATESTALDLSAGTLPNWLTTYNGGDLLSVNPAPILNPSTCSPPGELAMTLDLPSVVNVSSVGDLYTVIVTNTGAVTTTEARLLVEPGAGFTYVAASAAASSGVTTTESITVSLSPATPSAGETFSIVLSDVITGAADLDPSELMTFTFKLAADATVETDQPLRVSLQSGDAPTETCASVEEIVPIANTCAPANRLAFSLNVPVEVSLADSAGQIYTATVHNTGEITSTNVRLRVDPNVGFYYTTGTAAATDGLFTSNVTVSPATPAADEPFTITLTSLDNGENVLAPGETMTITFGLSTNASAKSGQMLQVQILALAESCDVTQQNVQVVRGNLIAYASPAVQSVGFGETVTWTVSMENNGLGYVYGAVVTPTLGAGLTDLAMIPASGGVDLAVNEIKPYTLTAVVNSCDVSTLNATLATSWPAGNQSGLASPANPLTEKVYVNIDIDDPAVSVDVGPLPPATYCGPYAATIPVTVTNTAGAARNLTLDLNLDGPAGVAAVVNAADSGKWSKSGSQITYIPGTLVSGETLNFSLDISSDTLCSGSNLSVGLTPSFQDSCLIVSMSGSGDTETKPVPDDVPTLSLSKSGPSLMVAGRSYTYTIGAGGNNQQNLGDYLTITDTVSSYLDIVNVSASGTTTATQTGNQLVWRKPITDTGSYAESFYVQVLVPTDRACNAGGFIGNSVQAVADPLCPDCEMTDSASTSAMIYDFLDPALNNFTKTSSPIELCGPDDAQNFTATLRIGSGITWTNTIYTDTLGAGTLSYPYIVTPGSVVISVDGVDRTSDVTVTLGAPFVVDFSNLGAVFGDVYSDTAEIVISFDATAAAGTIPGDKVKTNPHLWSTFQLNGPIDSCDGDKVAHFGTWVNLHRGDLSISASPETLASCRQNTVTLSVSENSNVSGDLTDGIELAFTTSASDIVTPTDYVLGGVLVGQIPTIEHTIGATQIVTFTFPPTFDVDGDGSISFPLYRPC
ncbi:MAG: hypothetical protein KDD84_07780, partial [Caldilineaceae bacterium]|nr:hypothetical protein [Caldilineaceae bacterium]